MIIGYIWCVWIVCQVCVSFYHNGALNHIRWKVLIIEASSVVSSNGILPFVYTSSGIFLVYFRMSSTMQGRASNGHWNICLVVSGACPHSLVGSPLKYVTFATPCYRWHQCVTFWDISTLSRYWYATFLDFHPGYVMSNSSVTAIHCSGWLFLAGNSAGHSFFNRLSAEIWLCREWAAFISDVKWCNPCKQVWLFDIGCLRHSGIDLHALLIAAWLHGSETGSLLD